MNRALRLRSMWVSAIGISTTFACGGAQSDGASSAASSKSTFVGKSAVDDCLAVADAKHERKPAEPDKITVKHVLVRYAGAKRAPESIARTREQACLRAQEALNKLREGVSFADVVRIYSDESGAATREGTIGTIERKDVAPPFADAAFELGVREVSQVVETDFGFHVIQRSE